MVPLGWNTLPDINVDFPTVAIGIILDTGKTINHRYDCISGTDNMNVKLLRPDFTADNGYTWKIEVAYTKNHDEDADINRSDWIDFNGNDLTGSGAEGIPFTVKEYVNDRNLGEGYNPDEDFREATLTLSVYKDGKSIYQTRSYIRQWNALIVKSYDEDGKELSVHRAFRRLDLGDSFDSDGKVIDGKQTYQWSYYDRDPFIFFGAGASDNSGDNGLDNYTKIKKDGIGSSWENEWNNSVICKAYMEQNQIRWYLPARMELHSFLHYMYNVNSAFVSQNSETKWWSATAVGDPTMAYKKNSYYSNEKVTKYELNAGNVLKSEFNASRNDYYRVRQATQNIQPAKKNN